VLLAMCWRGARTILQEVSSLLLAALKQSYDYLEDKRPRGLDVLARVATAVSATETVPVLAERLLDPNTPAAALKDVVLALTKLGGKDAIRSAAAVAAAVSGRSAVCE
jgi:hypothetical protein